MFTVLRRKLGLNERMKLMFVLLVVVIIMAYMASIVFFWVSGPSSQDILSSNENPLVSSITYNGCNSLEMYRHYPIPMPFTTSLHPSITLLDRAGCAQVWERIRKRNRTRCPADFALQCAEGRVCYTRKEEEDTIEQMNKTWTYRNEKSKRYETRPWLVVHHGGKSPSNLIQQGNAVLAALGLTDIVTRIESDIRSCHLPSKTNISEDCEESPTIQGNSKKERFTLVELGAGNGNLLYSFCPPDPFRRLRCYGVDLVPTIVEDAMSYQDHIKFVAGVNSPLRDGSVTHVLIHGLLPIATPKDGCAIIREGLRLLAPQGILLIIMIFTGFSAGWPTRHHPFFFNDSMAGKDSLNTSSSSSSTPPFSSSILRFCSGITNENYSELIEKVDFLWDAKAFSFYAPHFDRTGVYAVRLTRSNKPMQPLPGEKPRNETVKSEEGKLYKEMCADPEQISRVRDAQVLWADRVMEMQRTRIRMKVGKGKYIWISDRQG